MCPQNLENVVSLANMKLKHVANDVCQDINHKFLEMPIVIDNKYVVEGVLCNRFGGNGYLIAPSPQVGCNVKCNFCSMSDLDYHGNVSAEAILEQIALILNRGIKHGYELTQKPLKISFVKGGEALSNPELPKVLNLISDNLHCPIKISTTFPATNSLLATYTKVMEFAKNYDSVVQMQVSLISTDNVYRCKTVKHPLFDFSTIHDYALKWSKEVDNARKHTLSFTLTQETPCKPSQIHDLLPPDLFAVRIRDWMPTRCGTEYGLHPPDENTVQQIIEDFREFGYQIIPGKPGSTERENGLTAGHIIKQYMGIEHQNYNQKPKGKPL